MRKLRHLVFAHDTWFLRGADGSVWTDRGAFTWDRYLAVADRVTVVARMRDREPGSTQGLELVSRPEVAFEALANLATVRGRVVLRRAARRRLHDIVGDADAVVGRLPSEIGGLACRVADDLGVRWAVELVTCPWDSLWNYGTWQGRAFAPLAWWETRRLLRRAPFSLYVTQQFLQRRYPPGGHAVAVSDVAIDPPGPEVLARRLARIAGQPRPLAFGTIAALLPFKGLDTAFAALAEAAPALPAFEYRVLGAGEVEPFRQQAAVAGLGDRVRFDGTLPAGEPVLRWLDGIDVYLQPSRQEGLPRALVEAMSRGCPALGSTAGGIPELLDAACLHRPGRAGDLARLVAAAADPAWQERQARRNLAAAGRYRPEELDERRRRFWSAFAASRRGDVLFVTPYSQLGGSERQLLHLLDGLDDRWVGRVVALQDGPLLDRLRSRGHDPLLVPTGTKPGDIARAARHLRRIIRAERPKVVHAACAKGALVAGLASVGLGVPVLFVKHDFYWDGPVAWLAAALCDQVVAGSHALNRTFPAPLRRRLHVVHPGVPATEADREAGRRRVAELVPGAERVVAVVGRLHPDKGQLDAVTAVAAVPDVHLLVVGTMDTTTPGFEAEVVRHAEAQGIGERVVLAGEQDDVVGLLAGCDAVLVPTVVREGFGLAAVEGLRAGTPVIAYGHGGLPEVVGDCGVLVTPRQAMALADELARLLADAEAVERLRSCGPAQADRFTLEATVDGMVARYRAAISDVRSAMADPQASAP